MKRLMLNAHDLVESYRSGLTGQDLASQFNIGLTSVWRILNRAGLKARSRYITLPIDECIRRYAAGESVMSIGASFHVSGVLVVRRLKAIGYKIRTRNEAMVVRHARMTVLQRQALAHAANVARRSQGRKPGETERIAQGRQRSTRSLRSTTEIHLQQLLNTRGLTLIPQLAIGRYNCDLGNAHIAVEVFGGNWHLVGQQPTVERRYRHILNSNRHVVIVHSSPTYFPLSPQAADYIVAFLKKMRRQPSLPSQYRMIRGTGQLVASGSVHDKHISLIPALTLGRNRRTGRYMSIPR